MLSHQIKGVYGRKTWRSCSNFWIQYISATVFTKERYSNFVLDRAPVGCFLAPQEMTLGLRYTQYLLVDRLSSGLPAQSTFEWAWTFIGPNWKKWSTVPLRYRKMRLTAVQWLLVGLYINWQTWLTKKTISGRVRDRYCKTPGMQRYSVGSRSGSPSWMDSLLPATTCDALRFSAIHLGLFQ